MGLGEIFRICPEQSYPARNLPQTPHTTLRSENIELATTSGGAV